MIARAFAPASVANVAVGFDILGHALAGIAPTVPAPRTDAPTVRPQALRGGALGLPLAASGPTARVARVPRRAHARAVAVPLDERYRRLLPDAGNPRQAVPRVAAPPPPPRVCRARPDAVPHPHARPLPHLPVPLPLRATPCRV